MKTTTTNQTRRKFLRNTGATAAAIGFPTVIPASALGKDGRPAPSERVTMGFIGIGNRGHGVMGAHINHGDVQGVAVCDVHKVHFGRNPFDKGRKYGVEGGIEAVNGKYAKEKESGTFKGCEGYTDYRELCARDDIDAVMIATPDHWHGLICMEALRNGKDIYCEKPVTHFFAEGKAIYELVAKNKRIFQVGSQQRSDGKFQRAVEVVRNGLIGKVKRVEVGLPGGKTGPDGDPTVKEAPEGYDMWCGPSPKLPYMRARHHWSWRWHTAYGRGQLMDWIGHHNDIAHWGLGLEATGSGAGPLTVEAKNWDFSKTPDIYDTAWQYDVECTYAGGIELLISSRIEGGCKWIGEDGWIWVNRGRYKASNPEWLESSFDPGEWNAYKTPGHQRNFVDCVKNRKETIAPAENAHRAITPGHIAFVSHELGRKLKWDAKKERIVGDDEAQKKLMELPYRGDWKL